MNKRWKLLPNPPQSFFEQFPELPEIVARLLYHRNLRTQKEIDEFLQPDYSTDVHDPYLFKDMEKAVKRIFEALEKKEKIIVHGDYDADGVSGSVIIVSTLKALGCDNVDVFLPHRETDGYGLNIRTVELLALEETKLIITCDCGISNTKEVARANELGIDVIITDHHSIPAELPPAYAIIHPKIEGESYPDKGLAGGGVAFKLIQALLKKHIETNALLPNGVEHSTHEKWLLDMVAIASVADMVPLIGESRTLTKYGLIVLNKTKRLGLQKMLLEARLLENDGTKKREFDAYTIGFQIAPRINAAGRINHANVAYNLLMTDRGTDAVDLAYELDQNNKERQVMTEQFVADAIKQVEAQDSPVICVLGQGWPTGLVGLIAGKLKEKYQKPALVMALNNEEITGSGRSISGFNLIECLQELPELFSKFGGHPMACGFTLASQEAYEDFKIQINKKFEEKMDGVDLTPILNIDTEIQLNDVDWELYDLLEKFAPFGMANEKPKYLSRDVEVFSLKAVGRDFKHLNMTLKQDNKIRKSIAWSMCNGNEPNWCDTLKAGDKIDVVFEIDVNEWNGNRDLQLTIVDLCMSSRVSPQATRDLS